MTATWRTNFETAAAVTERVQRPIEDFSKGERASFRRTVKADDIDAFVDLSGDDNPLHLDDRFARSAGFLGRVVHGMLTSSYISTLLGTLLPGPGTLWLRQTLEFVHPVYVGDELTIVGEIGRISLGTRTLTISTRIYNQRGELVVDGSACARLVERKS